MVANGYFMSSLFCGVILILINNSTITFPAIVHALIIGFYLFHYLLLMNAETHTEANTQCIKQGMFFIKDCASRLRLIMDTTQSREVYSKIERFYDAVNAAMPCTRSETVRFEVQISELIGRLESQIRSGSSDLDGIVHEAIALIKERERIIALCH